MTAIDIPHYSFRSQIPADPPTIMFEHKLGERIPFTAKVPIRGADPVATYGRLRRPLYRQADMEEVQSRTAWRKKDRQIVRCSPPVGWTSYHFQGGFTVQYDLYRISDTVPFAARHQRPAVAFSLTDSDRLLQAIFTVNRSAKRHRDAAKGQYSSGCYKFASNSRRKKEDMYELKDAGIAYANRLGLIKPVRTIGSTTEYRSDRYCFHSYLRPVDLPADTHHADTTLYVESKRASSGEMRVCDAVATLEQLSGDTCGFVSCAAKRKPAKEKYFTPRTDSDEGLWNDKEFLDEEGDEDEDWYENQTGY